MVRPTACRVALRIVFVSIPKKEVQYCCHVRCNQRTQALMRYSLRVLGLRAVVLVQSGLTDSQRLFYN